MTLKFICKLLIIALSVTFLSSCLSTDKKSAFSNKITTGFVTNKNLNEISGIAISHKNEGIIWVNNDSGNAASLYAINQEGKHLATVHISNVENNDWEDLAIFDYKGERYILIADVGDNAAKRKRYQVHIIKEPRLSSTRQLYKEISIKPAWSITFTYPDNPRDSESVAVDIVNEEIILLSKRELPKKLFTLPLKTDSKEKFTVAKLLGEIPDFPAPAQQRFGLLDFMNISNMPTAIDISADNSKLAVLTYSSVYVYFKQKEESWLTAFSRAPKEMDFPKLQQAEAMGFDKEAKNIYITSEKIPAPIFKIPLSEE